MGMTVASALPISVLTVALVFIFAYEGVAYTSDHNSRFIALVFGFAEEVVTYTWDHSSGFEESKCLRTKYVGLLHGWL